MNCEGWSNGDLWSGQVESVVAKSQRKEFLGGSPPRGQSQLKICYFAPSFIGVREDEMAKWYKKSESLNENKSSDVLPTYHEDYLVALATCKRTCKFKTQSQLDV